MHHGAGTIAELEQAVDVYLHWYNRGEEQDVGWHTFPVCWLPVTLSVISDTRFLGSPWLQVGKPTAQGGEMAPKGDRCILSVK